MAKEIVSQLHRLNSRYTVNLIWEFVEQEDLYLVFEYYSSGNILSTILQLQELPVEERMVHVQEILAQIILSLDFMHSQGVIHRNIKPENIFLMEDGSIRLGDFCIMKELTEKDFKRNDGINHYIAPEVWMMKSMDSSTDIYSCGIITYEMLIGSHPFYAQSEQGIIDRIKGGDIQEMPYWVPDEMKKLLYTMLNLDPIKRPTTKFIMQLEPIWQQDQESSQIKANKEQGLYVRVVGVHNLSLFNQILLRSPYVVLSIGMNEERTQTKKNTNNVEFDEEFHIEYNYECDVDILNVEVWNEDQD
ncbi:MAG: putative protein kinase A catalytic subunit [Streblomastix strix]|uniref:Uncharacterized protein n=1 Tax=Streblomastix strix TaxID=222440 RepID=A0A5J4X9K9_9EUKA|nr:MAG: putative protein kinase A catalytic subunit [Streblomastix strix]